MNHQNFVKNKNFLKLSLKKKIYFKLRSYQKVFFVTHPHFNFYSFLKLNKGIFFSNSIEFKLTNNRLQFKYTE